MSHENIWLKITNFFRFFLKQNKYPKFLFLNNINSWIVQNTTNTMFKRIDTTEFQASGNLQRDSLEYLCISEESQHATLQQIANDLVELHRLQESEKRLGTDVTKSKLSAAEMLIKQKHSVEKIAKDLIELQMKLANMGNFYTISFLERYYNKYIYIQFFKFNVLFGVEGFLNFDIFAIK